MLIDMQQMHRKYSLQEMQPRMFLVNSDNDRDKDKKVKDKSDDFTKIETCLMPHLPKLEPFFLSYMQLNSFMIVKKLMYI